MPYNLLPAVPTPIVTPLPVFPQSLSTSFVMAATFPLLSISYNDGTFERSLIVDGVNAPRPLRTWALAKRLTTAQLTALTTFWNTVKGGLNPFWFYDPFNVVAPAKIGSNYRADGSNTQGRMVVYFRGDWAQHTELGRHVVPSLTLVEVA